MSDSYESVYGDKNTGKHILLQEALTALNVTYDRWLSARINVHTGNSPDVLANHFRTFYNEDGIQFYVKEGLPVDIRNACIFAFNNIFHTN
jgi:hypothetical protein